MVDLHMHTTYSDGSDSLIEVLKKAEKLKLEYISITDHDNCKSYEELDKIDVKKYYTGKIIPGIEIKCVNDNGKLVELLGYYIDPEKMQNWANVYYKDKSKEKLQQKYFDLLYEQGTKMGLALSPKEEIPFCSKTEWASVVFYNELKKHEENYDKLPKELMDSFDVFSKKYCSNPEFGLYIDKTKDYPTAKEAADIIKECGGLVFMPHVYIYNWIEDIDKHILKFKKLYGVNGVECFHSTFDSEKINHLLDFCKENNLFVSGGSDYHGTNKKNIEMAVGKGNLKIEAKYIKPWVNMMEDALVSHAKVAEEKIIEQILKVTNEYEKTKDATIKKQYLQLIMDKEKVENIDIKTIKKYVN